MRGEHCIVLQGPVMSRSRPMVYGPRPLALQTACSTHVPAIHDAEIPPEIRHTTSNQRRHQHTVVRGGVSFDINRVGIGRDVYRPPYSGIGGVCRNRTGW